jgi:hypothetical protein
VAIHLSRPIEIFFESDKGREAEATATCLAADATVHDEGCSHKGLAAIKTWKAEARRKYEYTKDAIFSASSPKMNVRVTGLPGKLPATPVEPLEGAQRDGKTVVTAGRIRS